MAGRTRSSLPTDQRRRKTTIPGMAGSSAEAQRAWCSPPERQQRMLWAAWAAAASGATTLLARCAEHTSISPRPHGPGTFRPLEMLIHAWAGPTSNPIHPPQPETGCSLTPKDSLVPKTGTSPLESALPRVTAIVTDHFP